MSFDPSKIPYGKLAEVFFNSHDPFTIPASRQYKSIIFYINEGQREKALQVKEYFETIKGAKVATEILPLGIFYMAEDYHQKYFLKNVPSLARELSKIYSDSRRFNDSTAVTRINGFLGGFGNLVKLEKEIKDFGLSPEAEKRLIDIARSRSKSAGE